MTVWSLMLSCWALCAMAMQTCTRNLLQRLFPGGGGPGLKLVVSGFQFLTLPSIVLRWQRHISLMQNLDNQNDSKKQHGVFPQRPAALLELLLLLLLSIIFRHPGFRLDEWDHLHWLYIHLYHSLHDIPRHPNCHLPRFGIYWTPQKKWCPENTQNETTRNRQFHPLKRPGSKACFIHLLQ